VAVSAVSLIGGAGVGPEKLLASMGAGVGSWVYLSDFAQRHPLVCYVTGNCDSAFASSTMP
jgi:hypothetical protein